MNKYEHIPPVVENTKSQGLPPQND